MATRLSLARILDVVNSKSCTLATVFVHGGSVVLLECMSKDNLPLFIYVASKYKVTVETKVKIMTLTTAPRMQTIDDGTCIFNGTNVHMCVGGVSQCYTVSYPKHSRNPVTDTIGEVTKLVKKKHRVVVPKGREGNIDLVDDLDQEVNTTVPDMDMTLDPLAIPRFNMSATDHNYTYVVYTLGQYKALTDVSTDLRLRYKRYLDNEREVSNNLMVTVCTTLETTVLTLKDLRTTLNTQSDTLHERLLEIDTLLTECTDNLNKGPGHKKAKELKEAIDNLSRLKRSINYTLLEKRQDSFNLDERCRLMIEVLKLCQFK